MKFLNEIRAATISRLPYTFRDVVQKLLYSYVSIKTSEKWAATKKNNRLISLFQQKQTS
jgi:hypothetical protein